MRKTSYKEVKILVVFNVVLALTYAILYKNNSLYKLEQYILFNTNVFSFKDLLSILITILTLLFGAMLTVTTVLISMCDRRLIRLIREFQKINYLKQSIRKCIIYGFMSILLYAIVYAQLDYRIFYLRVVILYIATTLLVLFLFKSILIIYVVIKLLSDSLDGNDSIEVNVKFKSPEDKK